MKAVDGGIGARELKKLTYLVVDSAKNAVNYGTDVGVRVPGCEEVVEVIWLWPRHFFGVKSRLRVESQSDVLVQNILGPLGQQVSDNLDGVGD